MALLPILRSSTRRRLVSSLLSVVAASSGLTATADVRADERVTRELNQLESVSKDNTAWRGLFDAYLDMTPCPQAIGADFNQVDVWPKMTGWAPIADWAATNDHVGDALKEAAEKIVIGLPYGADARDLTQKYRDAGLVAEVHIGDEGELTIDFSYLQAFRVFSTWTAAEMYRRFEKGEYTEGFDAAIANVEVMTEDGVAITHRLRDETLARVDDALDAGAEAISQLSTTMRRIDLQVANAIPQVQAFLQDALVAAGEMKLATIEIRRSPWRILYQPQPGELANENLFAAARDFTIAAGEVRSAAESLQSMQDRLPGALEKDPEMQELVQRLLTESLRRLETAQSRLFSVIVGGTETDTEGE